MRHRSPLVPNCAPSWSRSARHLSATGLLDALEQFARQWRSDALQIEITADARTDSRDSAFLEDVYFIVTEAVFNAVRHARPTRGQCKHRRAEGRHVRGQRRRHRLRRGSAECGLRAPIHHSTRIPLGGLGRVVVGASRLPDRSRLSRCRPSPVGRAADVKVLIVDDHEIVRRGLTAFLRSMTDVDTVTEAASGDEALSSLRGSSATDLPDVVLLDVHMPGSGGIATARGLVQEFPGIPFIFLTGHKEADVVRGAVALGASGFIFKDASTDDIEAAIRSAVEEAPTSTPMPPQHCARPHPRPIRSKLSPPRSRSAGAGGEGLVEP